MSPSIECKCEVGKFTCDYCLKNKPVSFYSLSSGKSWICDVPVDLLKNAST